MYMDYPEMKAANPSETSVTTSQLTQRHTQEEFNHH
jgi:hypothetical protein